MSINKSSITQLASRSLNAFTESLSEGMALIAEHVLALASDASILAEMNSTRGTQALCVIAEEEAAKYLILLDAARFDYMEQKDRIKQLKRFGKHFPKGIYVRAYRTSPATYGEMIDIVNRFRDKLYLDGPNGDDWIFENEVFADREGRFYVDFVNGDKGGEWITPAQFDIFRGLGPDLSTAQIVCSLARGNVHSNRGIGVLQTLWADFDPHEDTHWIETDRRNAKLIEQLKTLKIATAEFDNHDARRISESLLFPLNRLEMDLNPKPTEEDLRALQKKRRI